MEEKLIHCVSQCPELWDTRLLVYRDLTKKAQRWKEISNTMSVPVEDLKKRWKNLRDRYIKERKTSREKRSGSAAGEGSVWRFFRIMTFLEPSVVERLTSSNLSQPSTPSSPAPTPNSWPSTSGPPTPSSYSQSLLDPDETFTLDLSVVPPEEVSTPGTSFSLSPPATPVESGQPPPPPPGPRRGAKRKGQSEGDLFEKEVLGILSQKPDDEEMFLLSLAPRLRNLSDQKRSQLKIEILQAFHQAEFS